MYLETIHKQLKSVQLHKQVMPVRLCECVYRRYPLWKQPRFVSRPNGFICGPGSGENCRRSVGGGQTGWIMPLASSVYESLTRGHTFLQWHVCTSQRCSQLLHHCLPTFYSAVQGWAASERKFKLLKKLAQAGKEEEDCFFVCFFAFSHKRR